MRDLELLWRTKRFAFSALSHLLQCTAHVYFRPLLALLENIKYIRLFPYQSDVLYPDNEIQNLVLRARARYLKSETSETCEGWTLKARNGFVVVLSVSRANKFRANDARCRIKDLFFVPCTVFDWRLKY